MSVAAAEVEGGSRGWLRPLASVALTAALCFVLLRRVDVHELADWLGRVDRRYYAGYVALSMAGLLARSFPRPGDADVIRGLFRASLADDALGIDTRRDGERILYGYPVAVLASRRP